ncbi:MATE family efflux transporter [Caproicibacter fermentans]|uniref:Polysaccharide biosynthesis C-terminal domain-containing protein n=1 Tax=Caproicibacter fermentans TaxID=2576756 RepID=A0A7G8T6H3_9FIRM|nr:MATE family efflux transporter [Caproicibacter fermentans]QNK39214.1 polysaccharide biosynthesis C-terminal domain-containing protein [Caproicibacter fermentans]
MNQKRVFLKNAVFMTLGSVVLRFSGLWFRSCICSWIGASGVGVYQLIFSIFSLGITACTSGIGLAVTRMVAEGKGSRRYLRGCLCFALAMSFAAGAVLLAVSDFAACRLIGAPEAAAPLRLLAPGLPFIAVCACLKGYFFANRNIIVPMVGELWEQVATIGISYLLLTRTSLPELESLMIGNTLGEVAACAYVAAAFLLYVRRHGFAQEDGTKTRVLHNILHIAGPMLVGSFLRSSLFSAENLLIPAGLRKYGAGGTAALAQYGVMQGMVMPVIYFPMSFVSSVAMLLIPEIAEAAARGKRGTVRYSAEHAFRTTLMFGFLISTGMIVFADEIGRIFFGNEQAGNILRIMAPIVPLMYLDNVVDNMLKGLDQQMYSLKYNFSDSMMRVALISALIPVYGIRAYLAILFFSEIYNASLSISRLLKVTELKVDILGWIVFPAVSGALLYYVLILLKKAVSFFI